VAKNEGMGVRRPQRESAAHSVYVGTVQVCVRCAARGRELVDENDAAAVLVEGVPETFITGFVGEVASDGKRPVVCLRAIGSGCNHMLESVGCTASDRSPISLTAPRCGRTCRA
jgi:hypothetical protein